MEYNRNLSSVIDSIQDEGPSSSVKEGETGGSDSVDDTYLDKSVAPRVGAGHSAVRIFFIALLASLVVAGGGLFVAGGGGRYFSGVLNDFSTTTAAGKQVVDARLQEIRKKQVQLGNRVDRLAVAVADINTIINQWHAQQAVPGDVQPDRQDSISSVHPVVPDQQDPLPARSNEGVEASITEPDALPALDDEVRAAAVTEADSVSVPQAEVSETQVSKTDTAPSPHVETTEVAATGPDSTRVPGIQAGTPAVTEPDTTADTQPDVNATVTQPATRQDSVEQEWVINVAYFQKQELIQKLMAKLGKAGIATEQQQVTIGGKTGYRLRIPGFSTSLEASEYAKKNLGDDLRLKDPWVSRR